MSRRATLVCLAVLWAISACSASSGSDAVGAGAATGGEQNEDAGATGGETGGQNSANNNGGPNAANNGGQTGSTAGDPENLASVSVEPSLAQLSAVDGNRPQEVFKAVGTLKDGTKVKITNGLFTLESLAFGGIGQSSGKFVATGVAGGETEVRVEVPGPGGKKLKGTAIVRVKLERNVVAAGVPADAADKFATPAKPVVKDVAPNLVYPLEGAVMPQNVFPADVQWLTGNAGDLFELRFEKPNAVVRALVLHSGAGFNNHYLVELDAWRALAQSDPDDPVVVTLRRWDAASGDVIESPTVSFSFARAALTGSVYYWDIAAGRIQRIDDGTNVAVSFMPTPSQNCVGCHSVSPSGRYMAGRLGGGDNYGSVFDLTTDLTGDPPPSSFSTSLTKWWYSSWAPDEKRMVVARGNGGGPSLAVINPMTGADITITGTLPSNATQPSWSPDGKEIAYVADGNNWGDHATAGNIAILPVTGPDQVGTKQTIHAGASLSTHTPGGNADSYPAFSPDSKTITFTHGTGARSDSHQAALYLMGRDGGSVVRLDKACAGSATTDNYQSRFAPFDTGDHFWISYLSRRDYGNADAGTKGSTRQQIWVAAIRKNAKPGEDPSEVGYWLPGQNTKSQNISAYWAPRPCRKDGEGCSVGSECCGGDCRPDDEGTLVCSPPPPEECRMEGQTCSSKDDCCDGLPCTNNVCSLPVEIQ